MNIIVALYCHLAYLLQLISPIYLLNDSFCLIYAKYIKKEEQVNGSVLSN